LVLQVLKNHNRAPVHFVLWCSFALSFCTLEALQLRHSYRLIAWSFQCHSGIPTGAKYMDGHLSMSTPVMHCASAQSLWENREVHFGVGAEYWLLVSRAGHTINCMGIIWLSTASILYILHIALRNLEILTLSNSIAFLSYKIDIYKRRMIKLFTCFCICSYTVSSSSLYNFCVFKHMADFCWKACHLKCNDIT
jgi:hypothetical protein